jgi:chromosome segregation ATPase
LGAFDFSMSIDKRSIIIGVCVGMILMGVVGLVNAISYRDRLADLENEVVLREATIHELENLNSLYEEELKSKDSDIKELEDSLNICEENCSQLTARLNDLEMNNSALASEIQLLKRAVYMVGQEDIEELLWTHTEVSLQYEDLQREYD